MPAPSTSTEPLLPGSVWTAAAVARRLGVAASTLRGWSLRYGIGPVGHHAGRHRRYTAADVAELDTMAGLVEEGMTLTAAAAVARSGRFATYPVQGAVAAPLGPEREPGEAVEALVAAARRLDHAAASTLVSASLARRGVLPTWDGLCRPALLAFDGMGDCIDAELLLSWAVATSLRRLPVPRYPPGARRVLLACAASEQHSLSLEALLAALGELRVDARMLGAAVPAAALEAATGRLQPCAVVVWSQAPDTADAALLDALARRAKLAVAAGPGWNHITLHHRVARTTSLRDAIETASGYTMADTERTARARRPHR